LVKTLFYIENSPPNRRQAEPLGVAEPSPTEPSAAPAARDALSGERPIEQTRPRCAEVAKPSPIRPAVLSKNWRDYTTAATPRPAKISIPDKHPPSVVRRSPDRALQPTEGLQSPDLTAPLRSGVPATLTRRWTNLRALPSLEVYPLQAGVRGGCPNRPKPGGRRPSRIAAGTGAGGPSISH
jgi:hypothetical protein